MQVGVHRLDGVNVFLTEAHVDNFFPLLGKSIGVTAMDRIKAVPFNHIIQAYGHIQALLAAKCPVIFT